MQYKLTKQEFEGLIQSGAIAGVSISDRRNMAKALNYTAMDIGMMMKPLVLL